MNKLDSELLIEEMLKEGYTLASEEKEAGVIVFNTCSVRQHAEDRVYSYLGRLKREKVRHPQLVIAVIGCMAQLQQKLIHQKMPHVDILLGTTQFLQLPGLVKQARQTQSLLGAYEIEDVKTDRKGFYLASPHSAFISIIRGCDMPCTFCVVPTTRGAMVSRPMEEVVEEAKVLRDRGVREITLLGQTVDGYGKDLNRTLGLAALLEKLNEIEGIDRIRYITSHPSFITDELLTATHSLEKVCEYLHMPAQSGSDQLLKHMKRGYNRKKYLQKIEKIRKLMPHCAVASDFIVGYPGETEEDHRLSLSLIEECRFQNSFIFKYSRRPATVAYGWEDPIPEEIKKERNQDLLEIQSRVSLEWKQAKLGQVAEIMVDGPSKKDSSMFSGRTRSNDIVVFPIKNHQPASLQGELVRVKLQEANSYTLYGELVVKKEETPILLLNSNNRNQSHG